MFLQDEFLLQAENTAALEAATSEVRVRGSFSRAIDVDEIQEILRTEPRPESFDEEVGT